MDQSAQPPGIVRLATLRVRGVNWSFLSLGLEFQLRCNPLLEANPHVVQCDESVGEAREGRAVVDKYTSARGTSARQGV